MRLRGGSLSVLTVIFVVLEVGPSVQPELRGPADVPVNISLTGGKRAPGGSLQPIAELLWSPKVVGGAGWEPVNLKLKLAEEMKKKAPS